MTGRRIVSFLPSATEWICALGMQDDLVGVSHECDYPEVVTTLPRVTKSRLAASSSREIDDAVKSHSESQTSLYDLDDRLLAELRPDLILTQTLCNVCAVSVSDVQRSLARLPGCELLNLYADTFEGVINDAESLIAATGNRPDCLGVLAKLRQRIAAVHSASSDFSVTPRVTLLEWADPLYCAGHWTPQLIQWAGGRDPIGCVGQPSRQISFEDLQAADPDVLLMACCGFDLHRNESELQALKQVPKFQSLRCVRDGNVHVFDGSAWFNRPGPRLVDALERVSSIVTTFTISAAS